MDLSIVILTWNSERFIGGCLTSIHECLGNSALKYEIIVVDNGSSDKTLTLIDSAAFAKEHLLLVRLDCNRGTTVSRNIGLKRARGKYCCVLDSDVNVESGVFERLMARLEADAGVGLIVPKILFPGGAWQKSYDQFPTFLNKLKRFLFLRYIEANEGHVVQSLGDTFQIDYAISAFWLFRRSLLDKVGLLDERIFYSPEDVDFCLRVWKCGFRIVYDPTVHIVHHTQEISRGWNLSRAKLNHVSGLFYFFCKHRYFFRKPSFQETPELSVAA